MQIKSFEWAWILGLHPYRSVYDAWTRHLGLASEEREHDAADVDFRALLEGAIDKLCPELTELQRREWCEARGSQEWAHEKIPLVYCDDDGAPVKVVCLEYVGSDTERCPSHIAAKARVQCWLSGAHEAIVLAMVAGRAGLHLRKWIVASDYQWIADSLPTVQRFAELVQQGIPPMPDGSVSADRMVAALVDGAQVEPGSVIVADDDARDAAARLMDLKGRLKVMETEAEALEQQIKLSMGAHETMRAGSIEVRWRQVAGRSTVDSDLLKSQWPDVYAAALKTGKPSRRFELRAAK